MRQNPSASGHAAGVPSPDASASKRKELEDATTSLNPSELQKESFGAAMKLFHARDFAAAASLFEQAAAGPSRDVTHVARQHLSMCRQRIALDPPDPDSTEDLYHFGVGLIAQRHLADAERVLSRALDSAPEADHVLYALCLCRGLNGDLPSALQYLQRAIQMNSKNRSIARTDPDFLEFGRQSPLRELVFGDRSQSAKKES